MIVNNRTEEDIIDITTLKAVSLANILSNPREFYLEKSESFLNRCALQPESTGDCIRIKNYDTGEVSESPSTQIVYVS